MKPCAKWAGARAGLWTLLAAAALLALKGTNEPIFAQELGLKFPEMVTT